MNKSLRTDSCTKSGTYPCNYKLCEQFISGYRLLYELNAWHSLGELHTYYLVFASLVGQSLDPSGVTMLDSVKVYTKTKEAFGWPDDPQEEISSTPGLGSAASVDTETEIVNSVPPMTPSDK